MPRNVSHDEITSALEAKDSETLIELVRADSSLMEKDYFEAGTLLHEAAYRNLEPAIRYMVAAGVDVNVRGRLNDSPLHQAVEGRQWNAVDVLLELGADINWGAEKLPTPLFTAVIAQDMEFAEKLIHIGADVNARYVNQRSQERQPLDFAELGGDEAMIKLLKARGGKNGSTGKWIWKKRPTEERDRKEARLSTYIGRRAITQTKTFVREYPELLAPSRFGGLLQLAVSENILDLVNFALDLGAEIDGRAEYEETALRLAVEKGHLEIARILLKRGADPNLGAGERRTAIFDAAWNDNVEMARLLLDHGADVNASFMHAAGFPRNALEAVSGKERGAMYDLLIQHGAVLPDVAAMVRGDPKAATKIGRSCIQNGYYETAANALTVAIELKPSAEAFYQRGVAFDMLKRLPEAVADLTKAIELDGQHFQALYSRSLVFRKLNRWAEAKADLEAAIRVDDDDFIVVNGLAHLLATAPDPALRDGKAAVLLAQKSCELTDWEDPTCVHTLAAAYREAGELEKAAITGRRAVEIGQTNANGKIFEYIKEQCGAEIQPNGLQEIVPSDPPIVVWVAKCPTKNLLFTTGLSEFKLQSRPEGDEGCVKFGELCMYVPSDWPTEPDLKSPQAWPMPYLRRLAKELHLSRVVVSRPTLVYPVDLPEVPLAAETEFRAVLLVPQFDPLNYVHTEGGRAVEFITVVPLYAEEHQLAKTTDGIAELFQRLDKLGVRAELRPGRVNVAT
jgi:ankyrin repeat protein